MTRPIRRILVAIKDVRSGNSAMLRKAARLAKGLHARIELFHAITDPVPVDAHTFEKQGLEKLLTDARQRYLRRLEKLATSLQRTGVAVSVAAEWDFPAHEAVIRRARLGKADLVIAQQHGTRHVAPALLRYTDWELLRQSPVPVLLFRNARAYDSPRILAAIDPSHAFAKTANLDDEILRGGARMAAAARGQLHVIHTYTPTLLDMVPAAETPADATAQIAAHAARGALTRFDKALRSARLGKLAPGRRHLIVGHAIDAIPALAKRLRCNVVVMGAISRSGIKRLAVGNTAEQVLDALPCDVLIVKPRGFVSHIENRPRGPQRIVLGLPAGVF